MCVWISFAVIIHAVIWRFCMPMFSLIKSKKKKRSSHVYWPVFLNACLSYHANEPAV